MTVEPIRFTIITPVKNGLAYVNAYSRTLIGQTYQNWRAIIVDDGSTDGTCNALYKLCEQDRRITLVVNDSLMPSKGPSRARNKALQMADGDYICFLDIDDLWHQDKLTIYAKIILREPRVSLIYSSYMRVRRGLNYGKIRNAAMFYPPRKWISVLNPVPMLTSCVRLDVARGLCFSELNHEDYLFWHSLIGRLGRNSIHVDAGVLAVYSVHQESLSANKFRSMIWLYFCYRSLGYSRARCLLMLLLRGLLQLFIVFVEAFAQPVVVPPAFRGFY